MSYVLRFVCVIATTVLAGAQQVILHGEGTCHRTVTRSESFSESYRVSKQESYQTGCWVLLKCTAYRIVYSVEYRSRTRYVTAREYFCCDGFNQHSDRCFPVVLTTITPAPLASSQTINQSSRFSSTSASLESMSVTPLAVDVTDTSMSSEDHISIINKPLTTKSNIPITGKKGGVANLKVGPMMMMIGVLLLFIILCTTGVFILVLFVRRRQRGRNLKEYGDYSQSRRLSSEEQVELNAGQAYDVIDPSIPGSPSIISNFTYEDMSEDNKKKKNKDGPLVYYSKVNKKDKKNGSKKEPNGKAILEVHDDGYSKMLSGSVDEERIALHDEGTMDDVYAEMNTQEIPYDKVDRTKQSYREKLDEKEAVNTSRYADLVPSCSLDTSQEAYDTLDRNKASLINQKSVDDETGAIGTYNTLGAREPVPSRQNEYEYGDFQEIPSKPKSPTENAYDYGEFPGTYDHLDRSISVESSYTALPKLKGGAYLNMTDRTPHTHSAEDGSYTRMTDGAANSQPQELGRGYNYENQESPDKTYSSVQTNETKSPQVDNYDIPHSSSTLPALSNPRNSTDTYDVPKSATLKETSGTSFDVTHLKDVEEKDELKDNEYANVSVNR